MAGPFAAWPHSSGAVVCSRSPPQAPASARAFLPGNPVRGLYARNVEPARARPSRQAWRRLGFGCMPPPGLRNVPMFWPRGPCADGAGGACSQNRAQQALHARQGGYGLGPRACRQPAWRPQGDRRGKVCWVVNAAAGRTPWVFGGSRPQGGTGRSDRPELRIAARSGRQFEVSVDFCTQDVPSAGRRSCGTAWPALATAWSTTSFLARWRGPHG